MARILIAGAGYVGGRLASMLVDDGETAFGLRRSPERLPDGVEGLAADVTDPESLRDLPGELDALVYAVSPGGRDAAAYRAAYRDGYANVLDAVADSSPELRRVLLVSSTGVYGYADGRRVDETTPPEPADPTGVELVAAEEEAMAREPGAVVLRLGGIYGPGRTRLIRRVISGKAGCPPSDRYTNRIHRDDAAGALRHLLSLPDPRALYLGVDREPASLQDVYRWVARRADAPDPCRDARPETWEARGRRGTNKRCSSDRLAASGYAFRYPSFRDGYAELVDAEVEGNRGDAGP
jgi:nucleoside-diphosphate-sugar epimerase